MREYGGERRWKQKDWRGYLIILIHIFLRKSVWQNWRNLQATVPVSYTHLNEELVEELKEAKGPEDLLALEEKYF